MANTRSTPASSPPAHASKKRGASDSAEATPAKKRGRPAAAKKEVSFEKVAETADADEALAEAAADISTPVKRGRGRPKKDGSSPAKQDATPVKPVAEKITSPTKTPAKKAGRPKKQATIEDAMNVDSKDENGVESKEENGADAEEEVKQNGDNEKVDEPESNSTDKANSDEEETVDEVMKNTDSVEDDSKIADQINSDAKEPEEAKSTKSNGIKEGEKNAFDEVKANAGEVKKDVQEEQESKTEAIAENNDSIVEDPEREAAMPRSILEKGIVYFFYRPRVNIEDPQGIEDIARSFIVLRPIPLGAKLGEGPLEDSEKARLLALPKKMVPKSKQDKFLMFTDKVGMSIKDIRDEFAGNEYATKTAGLSNSPSAAPFAEGVYVITSTDGASHLAYLLTKPSPLGEIQKELGLHEKGSFVLSAKNPESRGPANATIDNPAEYPEDIQKHFRGRNWMPLVPAMLDYVGTQFLIIGEGLGEFSNAVKEMAKDKKDNEKEKPEEELEKLEEEDHDRVSNLEDDDPVFTDLGLSSKEYSKIKTSW